MVGDVLLTVGSAVIVAWGIAHVVPTRGVVAGLGDISLDSRRIATMGWIAEGLTFCFIGALVVLVTFVDGSSSAARLVPRASATMLIAMAALSLATGARTPILPMKLCPVVKAVVAVLFVIGSFL